ncbi:MAG: hypothetical protein ACOY90_11435 [Candidatus Zhuqueibacterota bacterium]
MKVTIAAGTYLAGAGAESCASLLLNLLRYHEKEKSQFRTMAGIINYQFNQVSDSGKDEEKAVSL